MDKVCSGCKQSKPVEEFGSNRAAKDGKSWYCRECTRARGAHRRTLVTYKAVFEKYGYRCSLCGTSEHLEVHHCEQKSNEELENLVLACRDCHIRVLHKGAWPRKAERITCLRCGHSWYPKGPEVRICPKCKSPYWDREKGKKGC